MRKEKILVCVLMFSLMTILLGQVASAQWFTTPPVATNVKNTTNVQKLMNNIRNIVFGVCMFIAIVMLIWAGVGFMTASGDPNKIASARSKLMYGLIGVAVAVAAAGLIQLVKNLLGAAS
ncbi:MAG: TrbC/VirB2 family protein [Candidatus Pacebacteria bacterium]|nr:TrbC/VirB2 family protein [Candidatus Paceibacterota bacterium]